MSKKITSFNIDKAISRIAKPSIFDRIVKEVEAKEIPVKYIESVIVQYYDGQTVELSGNALTHPIPLNKGTTWEAMEDSYRKMREVKIFINTEVLEKDINELVENLLGSYC